MLFTENTAKNFKLSKFPVKYALCTKNTSALVYKQQHPVSSIQQSRAGPSLHVCINPAQVSLYLQYHQAYTVSVAPVTSFFLLISYNLEMGKEKNLQSLIWDDKANFGKNVLLPLQLPGLI